MHQQSRERNVTLKDTSVTTCVGIGPRQAGGVSLTVRLEVSLPGIDPALARTRVGAAHNDICPYLHTTRNNAEVAVELT